jgi:hypothetical protein
MAGLARRLGPSLLAVLTGFLRVVTRGILLMGRVRMVLGLEVLGLVRGTFAVLSHEVSKFGSRSALAHL